MTLSSVGDTIKAGHQEYPVTEESLRSVPLVQPDGWSKDQAEALQEAHRDLLRLVKDQPVGTEAYGLYNAEMKFVGSKVGKPGDREIYIPDLDYPYIAVHNHPDGMTFSESDVFNFIRYPNLQVLTAVGNSGHVYLLEKSIDFAIADFLKAFQKIRSDYPHMMDSPKDYEDAMKSFLKRGVDYGINYFEGRP